MFRKKGPLLNLAVSRSYENIMRLCKFTTNLENNKINPFVVLLHFLEFSFLFGALWPAVISW